MLSKEAIKIKNEYYEARQKYLQMLCDNNEIMEYDSKIEDLANAESFGEIFEEAKSLDDDFRRKDINGELQKMSDEEVHMAAMKEDWLLFKIEGLALEYGKELTANNGRRR